MARGQFEQVIGRMAKDAAFRRAVREDLHKALALGGYTLTEEEQAALVQADAPELALDRRITKGLEQN